MSAAPASRAMMLRQARRMFRPAQFRNASSTSEVASKAKETASNTVSKASEGLSKVTTSAGSALSGAAASTGAAVRRVGGPLGRVIKTVESLIPPTIYYSRVGLELGKIMFQGQKMAPPNLQVFQSYFQPVLNAVRRPSQISSAANSVAGTPETALKSLRSVSGSQITAYGVVAAQLLGFFTLGTMIGRLKLVGYHGKVHHEEH